MQRIKNIIFDFGCVLVDLDKARCVEAFKAIGAESISSYVDECRQEDLFHDLETGTIDIAGFCDEVRRKASGCTAGNEEICEAWNSLLTGIPQRRLRRLMELKKRYRLFVLSNTNPVHWHKAVTDYFPYDGFGIDDYFEKTFLSCDMHMVKPDEEIYRKTLLGAGIKAEETVFIDDSPANCAAARQLGIKTVNVKSGDEWLGIDDFDLITSDNETSPLPCVATIGFFDGVHKGHRHLINEVVSCAKDSGMKSLAITFDRHPRQVVQEDYRQLSLTTNEEKEKLFLQTGIDACHVLHFDKAMASLTAREFMKNVLYERLNVRKLIIGYDNRFGRNRTDSFDDYVRYGKEMGIDVMQATALEVEGTKISSSVIRSLILKGDVDKAAEYLGRPYSLCGTVVSGVQEGRKIGFPTANIHPEDSLKIVPSAGVYAVRVWADIMEKRLPGMMNIGTRPTFGNNGMTLEVNIFDFHENLYGRKLNVEFIARLREERKFGSIDLLVEQLKKDKENTLTLIQQ